MKWIDVNSEFKWIAIPPLSHRIAAKQVNT